MKKSALFLVLVLLAGVISAQPNGGFENWSAEFSYEIPDGWQTFNALSLGSPPSQLSAFKVSGIDKHSGNYALKLKSIALNNNFLTDLFGDTAGGAFTGKIIYSPTSLKYGFPHTQRSEKLDFWARYYPVGSDTGGVIVVLSKWNGVKTDTVALGYNFMTETPTYSLFQEPLIYYSNEIPDSATILFYTSRSNASARVNSTLFVDDVSFSGWVGVDDFKPSSNNVKVFPNPANEHITILVEENEVQDVMITDISGRNVGYFPIVDNKAIIDTRLFQKGLYFYEIRDHKKSVLQKGKFNILK